VALIAGAESVPHRIVAEVLKAFFRNVGPFTDRIASIPHFDGDAQRGR